jgi:hypothetical protein
MILSNAALENAFKGEIQLNSLDPADWTKANIIDIRLRQQEITKGPVLRRKKIS